MLDLLSVEEHKNLSINCISRLPTLPSIFAILSSTLVCQQYASEFHFSALIVFVALFAAKT